MRLPIEETKTSKKLLTQIDEFDIKVQCTCSLKGAKSQPLNISCVLLAVKILLFSFK